MSLPRFVRLLLAVGACQGFARAEPVISEFLASNLTGAEDEDGNREDWIEIHNPDSVPVNLAGWHLTDDAADPDKWTFPSVVLPARGYLVVWASNKDRNAGELHTNFRLSAEGEYLALTRPDQSVAFAFAPAYPPQAADVSYGLSITGLSSDLVAAGSAARVRIPADDADGSAWTAPAYDDSGWAGVTVGVGFDTPPAPVGASGLWANSVSEFSGTQGLHNWQYGLHEKAVDANGTYEPDDFTTTYAQTPGDGTARTWTFVGGIWDITPGNPPWSALTSQGGHPNGQAVGGVQAVVRRWVSEFTGVARVTGRMAHATAAGDGVTCRILVEGAPVHVRNVYNTAIEYTVSFPVRQGQRVDFYTDPGPAGADGNDSFTFTARITGEAIADSVADWTETGTQGTRGWSYGSWNKTADADQVYATGEFLPFPRSPADGNTVTAANAWDGTRWKTAAAPLLELTQSGGKPQVTGGTNWVIRRWTSTRSGPARLMGVVGNPGGGDGVTGRLLINGAQVLALGVNGYTEGYSVVTNLAVGALVDLALDPNATEAGDADSIFTCNIAAAAEGTVLVADSVVQWGAGAQNTAGWSYGYYNRTADADGVFAAGEVNFTDPNWTGAWSLGPGDPPWTTISQRYGHPNGSNNGAEHWAVKRWTSTVAGSVSVDWHVSRAVTGGNGVTLKLFHNGVEKSSAAVSGTDRVGAVNTTVVSGLAVGDVIDLALTPVGPSGATDDGNDTSTLGARVLHAPAFTNAVRTLVADSQADWSTSGTQGHRGWYSGYYDKTADGDGTYAAGDFTAFPRAAGAHGVSNFWTGAAWDWFNGNPPWTELGALYSHPNGGNNGAEHWVVRRWTADTAGNLDLEWHVRKGNPLGGGVGIRVFHNGGEVDAGAIAGADTTGIRRTVRVNGVAAGDHLDVCLTPVGLGGGTDDGSDGSFHWVKVHRVQALADHIAPGGDLAAGMLNVNASAHLRVPFVWTNTPDRLTLAMRYDDGFAAYLNGVEVARRHAPEAQAGGRLADSAAEFGSTQGVGNWNYGTHNVTADLAVNGQYDTADFRLTDPNWAYSTGAWRMGPGDPPWTFLSGAGGHPNGLNSAAAGGIQWPVRRWIAERSGTLRAHLWHRKAAAGAGTTARLFRNGTPLWVSVTNDPAGNQAHLVIPDVQAGDLLDLALDAEGVGGDPNDSNDASELSAWYGQVPSAGLTWNAAATASRASAEVAEPEVLDLTPYLPLLVTGTNVLAFHGLNADRSDPDFLLAPVLTTETSLVDLAGRVYHLTPSPGGLNGAGSATIGPVVSSPARLPAGAVAATNEVVVTALVTRSVDDVAAVRLHYRTMFGPEVLVPMTRVLGDAADGSGTYQAAIPASVAAPGDMLRWRIEAEDATGDIMRHPPFPDPLNSPEYLGVVIADPAVSSALPILHTFLANPGGADAYAGTRMSLEYGGEFLDNVFINLHGQSSQTFPKKSHNVNLNTGHKLRWHPDAPRVNSFNLLTTYPDKANMRNLLAMEVWRDAGAAHSFALPVQMRRNGAFHSVTHLVEDGDPDYLQRLGLGEDNALYKMYNSLENADPAVNNGNGAEKKSRTWEDWTDLQSLVSALAQTGVAKERYLFDNAGIPETVNYQAALILTGNTDTGHKNYFMFRDSEGSREWFPTPWDVDLSFGRVWSAGPTYFDDVLYTNTSLYVGIGNRFTGPFLDNSIPALRQMYLRRLRTLADTLLQPVATAYTNRLLEAKIDAYAALLEPDTTVDFGLWPSWGSNQTQAVAVDLLKGYLNGRRHWIFAHPDLPPAQAASVGIDFGPLEFSPASGLPAEEYFTLVNPNAVAVDVSGWRVAGAVAHTLRPGTVIPAGGTLHLSPDVNAFRARAASPRANESRFVQGNYQGNLSARGETLELWDGDRLVATLAYAGAPSAAQLGLRVTELEYNPGIRAGDTFADRQQYEFIEFMNISTNAVDLAGVTFANGVVFACPAVSLAPGERRVAVRSRAAFQERHPAVSTNLVLGVYGGSLNNAGERVTLLDAVGEEILDFSYLPSWHPATAGQGHSLTVADEAQEPDLWNTAGGWKPSGRVSGTPTLPDSAGDADGDGLPDLFETQSGLNPLSPADAGLDGDGDGHTNLQEYHAGTDPALAGSVLALSQEAWSALTGEFTGEFTAVAGRTYTVQRSFSPSFTPWVRVLDHTAAASGPVPFTEVVPADAARRYYRVVTPQVP